MNAPYWLLYDKCFPVPPPLPHGNERVTRARSPDNPWRTIGLRRGAGVVERDGLENRCTGNRTVGSNPTLSARTGMKAADFSHSEKVTYKCTYKCLRSGGRKAVGSLSAMIHWEGFSTVPCIHKSRSVSSGWSTSALLPKADIGQRIKHVCVTLKRAKCSGKLHPSARRRLPPAFVLELTIAESKRAGSAFKEISP